MCNPAAILHGYMSLITGKSSADSCTGPVAYVMQSDTNITDFAVAFSQLHPQLWNDN